jgi:hypothetical protein
LHTETDESILVTGGSAGGTSDEELWM